MVAIDIDDDGWPDLLVARDASPNLLLLNRHDGTFVDAGLEAEIAFDRTAMPRPAWGWTLATWMATGVQMLWSRISISSSIPCFSIAGKFPFEDWTRASRLAGVTRSDVGWGVHFLDFDNDGLLDLMIVNGHVNEVIESLQPQVKYREQPLLLHNTGSAVFEDVSSRAGVRIFTRLSCARTGDRRLGQRRCAGRNLYLHRRPPGVVAQ